MPSPFDMITHSPIMQLANLARAGQNPMGLILAASAVPTLVHPRLFLEEV